MVQVMEEDSCDFSFFFFPPPAPQSKVGCKNKTKQKQKTCKTAQDQEVARLTLSIIFIRYL